MSPPLPPLPPLGPPKGMHFSRRKLMQPAPPLPAAISITASSTNFMGGTSLRRRRLQNNKRESPGMPGLVDLLLSEAEGASPRPPRSAAPEQGRGPLGAVSGTPLTGRTF